MKKISNLIGVAIFATVIIGSTSSAEAWNPFRKTVYVFVTNTAPVTVTNTTNAPAATNPTQNVTNMTSGSTSSSVSATVSFGASPTQGGAKKVAYSTGTGTNSVGMVGGESVLIENACDLELWVRVKRLDGPGAVTMAIGPNSTKTILLGKGVYSCTWGKKSRGLPAGSAQMTVAPENNELTDGEGEFVATLRLTPE